MNENGNDAAGNLEFFRSAILEPTLRHQSVRALVGDGRTVSDFGAIETAHWARLGVRIGYFDAKAALELFSSSDEVFEAWSNLKSREIISPDDDWARIIRLGESGKPFLNSELFSPVQIAPRTRELLQNTFQNFLLLVIENILNDDSINFLDSIGWTSDGKWEARRGGGDVIWLGNVQSIGSGFANVLNYCEEMDSSSRSVEEWSRIHLRKGQDSMVKDFMESARAILAPRLNLGTIEIVDRYFALAGEFTNRAREDSPSWLDARQNAFYTLFYLIRNAGGVASMEQEQTRLWNLFTKIAASPMFGNETTTAESLWERRVVEPPEEETSV